MKVELWFIGKTQEEYLRRGEEIYRQRLRHYLPLTVEVLPDLRKAGKLTPQQRKEQEGQRILSRLLPADGLILLDEGGRQFTSVELAHWLERERSRPYRRLVFLVGGAFGFSPAVYARANAKISLSRLTFSHQMVRLFLLEQLYRAMTILGGEKYHNP